MSLTLRRPRRAETPRPPGSAVGVFQVDTAGTAPLQLDDMAGLLRAITRACPDRSSRVIQVIAAHHGEGVSTVAGALAYTATVIDGANALVCDATSNQDMLRRGASETELPSLCDLITEPSAALSAVVPIPKLNYAVCMVSRPETNAHPAMRADRLGMVLERLRATYDWIIMDCPPVSDGSFGPALARLCDGTILVAQAGNTRRSDALGAQRAVDLYGGRLLGMVLNKVSRDQASGTGRR